ATSDSRGRRAAALRDTEAAHWIWRGRRETAGQPGAARAHVAGVQRAGAGGASRHARASVVDFDENLRRVGREPVEELEQLARLAGTACPATGGKRGAAARRGAPPPAPPAVPARR